MSVLKELKRRNVIRVAVAYVAISWLLIQVVETIFPLFELPYSAARMVVIVLGVGLPTVGVDCTGAVFPDFATGADLIPIPAFLAL